MPSTNKPVTVIIDEGDGVTITYRGVLMEYKATVDGTIVFDFKVALKNG